MGYFHSDILQDLQMLYLLPGLLRVRGLGYLLDWVEDNYGKKEEVSFKKGRFSVRVVPTETLKILSNVQ